MRLNQYRARPRGKTRHNAGQVPQCTSAANGSRPPSRTPRQRHCVPREDLLSGGLMRESVGPDQIERRALPGDFKCAAGLIRSDAGRPGPRGVLIVGHSRRDSSPKKFHSLVAPSCNPRPLYASTNIGAMLRRHSVAPCRYYATPILTDGTRLRGSARRCRPY